jgi:hypothetical protein
VVVFGRGPSGEMSPSYDLGRTKSAARWLLAARYAGIRSAEIDGRRVTYAGDAEMAAAITDLERRIAAGSEDGRRRRILTSPRKVSECSPR